MGESDSHLNGFFYAVSCFFSNSIVDRENTVPSHFTLRFSHESENRNIARWIAEHNIAFYFSEQSGKLKIIIFSAWGSNPTPPCKQRLINASIFYYCSIFIYKFHIKLITNGLKKITRNDKA